MTCPCQNCGGGIEFDVNYLDGIESAQVECPHCHGETAIAVPKPPPKQISQPKKISNDGTTLKGVILDYSVQTNLGVISGDDARRYQFEGSEWKVRAAFPMPGVRVEFVPDADKATAIYNIGSIKPSHEPERKCNHIIAAVTAIFLGCLGIHKFYMGYTREGMGCLAGTIGGLALCWLIIPALLVLAICCVTFVEGIIYLSMTQEQFDKTYLLERKAWF